MARPPVTAPTPPPSIPGTMCAPALAAQIAVDKVEDRLPHYRQSKRIWRKYEIDLRRQTLNSWFRATTGHLNPLGEFQSHDGPLVNQFAEPLEIRHFQTDRPEIVLSQEFPHRMLVFVTISTAKA